MPFRPYNLDTGFDTRPVLPPAAADAPQGNILWDSLKVAGGVGRALMPTAFPQQTREYQPVVSSAFRLENDVLNFAELMTAPVFASDPAFDLEEGLKRTGMWNWYKWNFIGVQSEPEMNAKIEKIKREEHDKALLASAGPSGMAAMVAAGLVSPVNLLPLVGPGLKGAKAVGFGLGMGALAGGLQEVPLQANQETRDLGETVFSVALSTVIGGVLGGAVGYLGRSLDDVAADVGRDVGMDMAVPGTEGAIPSTPRSVGAAAAPERVGAGPLKSALGQDKEFMGGIGPVTRVLRGVSEQGQWMMAQLADAGLMLEGNARGIATSVGGTAENRIIVHWAKAAEVVNKLDDAYARYMLGKEGQASIFDVANVNFQSLNPRRTKLSKGEFKKEVGRAMINGDEHEIPEVAETAAFTRKTIYDALGKEAEGLGLLKGAKVAEDGSLAVIGDLSYLNRDYKLGAIVANRPKFEGKLSAHYQGKLQTQFAKALERVLKQGEKTATRTEDLARPLDEVKRLQKQFTDELEQLQAQRTPEEVDVDEFLADARSMSFDKKLSDQQRADARAMVKMIEEQGGASLAARAARRREIRERLRSLTRSAEGRRVRQAAKLERVRAIEENTLETLNRTVRRAQKFLAQLDRLSGDAIDKEMSALKDRFEHLAREYDRGEERISKMLSQPDDEIGALMTAEERQLDKAERLTKIADDLGKLDETDRELAKITVQEALDEMLVKAARINGRRFSRAERLEQQAADLDPALAKQEADALRARQADREAALFDRFRDFTPGLRLEKGFVPDFSKHADEAARRMTERILGTNARLAGYDAIMDPSGAELARVLDIPSNEIEEFLELDIEHLVSQYIRTLAPDIEITKKLGEYAPDLGRNLEFTRLNDEWAAKDRALHAKLEAEGKTPEEIGKAATALSNDYAAIRRDLEVVIERLRHRRGLPSEPTAMSERLGRIAMNANVLRYMNMVTISSIPDIAQPIHRYGLLKTFRHGWVPFAKGLAQMKLVPRELRLLGAATDMTLHSRAYQISDIGDYMVRGTKFEKGLEYATSKIGMIALFDVWTTAMKQIAGTTANAVVLDALRDVMEGAGSKKAVEYLASLGIDGDGAQRLWKELQAPKGSDIVNGVLWPNTESWADAETVMLYRQAVSREVNRTIVTPGVERPSWMDKNTMTRLLSQFKSFAMSSTTRTVLADLQQRDMAAVNGSLISLALGGLSYYIWANITGGKALEDMNAALAKGDYGRFTDEAISRSGLLGALEPVQSILSTLPATAPYVTVAGERLSRQADNDFLDALGGPTLDLLRRGYNATSNLPQFTKSNAHQARLIAPFQNHFLLRKAYDAIEDALPLPERAE